MKGTQQFQKKLKLEHTADETQSYRKNWIQRVQRMENSRIPRMALAYKQGKSDIGRPRTRWRDQKPLQDCFHRTRPRRPTSVYVHDGDDDDDDDDDPAADGGDAAADDGDYDVMLVMMMIMIE
jgi:hypothetical protein